MQFLATYDSGEKDGKIDAEELRKFFVDMEVTNAALDALIAEFKACPSFPAFPLNSTF